MGTMQLFLAPQRYSSRRLGLWGGSMLAAAAVLAILVAIGGGTPIFQPLDQAWYDIMRSQRAEFWLGVNRVFNWLGYTGVFIYQGLFLLLLFRSRRWSALFIAVAALSVVALTQSLKYLLDRERPEHHLFETSSPSFPSGHSTATVAAMVATGFIGSPTPSPDD